MFKKISPLALFVPFLALSVAFLVITIASFFSAITYTLILILFLSLLFLRVGFRYRKLTDDLNLKKEELQEKGNLAVVESARLKDLAASLEKKIRNYQYLEKFTERLNNETSLDEVCDSVVSETFNLFGSKGNALLYLIHEKTRRLQLRAARKEYERDRIKEKTGDLFDEWCLRYRQPLLVEAVTRDFRFNPDRIKEEVSRPVKSLICVPLVTQAKSLGILRVDSPETDSYRSDDLRFLSVVSDISKLAIENAIYLSRMQTLSITDGLTGVYLRRHALKRLQEEFLRAQRENIPLCFCMFDIDHFKELNDEFGHMAGDVVLKKMAKWLKESFGLPGSLIFRYGGEEFGVILPHVEKREVIKLAESFRRSLQERKLTLRRRKARISVSVGIAVFPDDVRLREDLVRCADEALFKAKRSGRNRVCHL